MAITVNVEPGELEEYRERVGKLNKIMKRLGVAGTVRMWRPQLAGPAALRWHGGRPRQRQRLHLQDREEGAHVSSPGGCA